MTQRRLLLRLLVFLLLLAIPVSAQTSSANRQIFTDEASGITYQVESFLPANFPVGMVFAPDGRLFYNEKTTGNVRVVTAEGELLPDPLIYLPTSALSERGMLGLALDPDFADNHLMYVVHTQAGTERNFPANRLVRFPVSDDNTAGDVEELLRYPIETGLLLHNGGNVHFDSDGYLYLSLGDYGAAANAQNLDTPQGAIHRFEVTEAGLQPAPANPFGDANSIYAYGLRNPFDFTIDPFSDYLFASESGPACDDEINVIEAGGNYGWRENYECVGTDPIDAIEDYQPPLLSYEPPIAPTGIVVYQGEAFPAWEGDLFFCDWVRGNLRRVELNDERTAAEAVHTIDLGDASCKIDLVIGPDGGFYFGSVGSGGGMIYRLLPDTVDGES